MLSILNICRSLHTTRTFHAGKLGKFRNSAIATDSPLCSKIGKTILDKNGSFVDAAIASLLCLGVVNVHNMGIGGGTFYTIYRKEENKFYTLDARETAPSAARENMFESEEESLMGARSIAVPGEVAGFWELHQKFGRLPWEELFKPSIELCKNGFQVQKGLADVIRRRSNLIIGGRDTFINHETGELKKIGDIVELPKLAKTLEKMAEYGAECFYRGDLAATIVDEIRTNGGIVTKEDFVNYEAKWRTPVRVEMNVRGERLTIGAVPPPSSSALVAFILKAFNHFNVPIDEFKKDPVKNWHRFLELSKFAYAARARLGDVDFTNAIAVLDELFSDSYLDYVHSAISKSSTPKPIEFYGNYLPDNKAWGTSHLSLLAPNGDAISATSSINQYFGSKVIGNRTGIVYNDAMDDFSQPGRVNTFGLIPSEANFISPGKRPMSSMSPVIITDENLDVRYICGASGGARTMSGIAQVLWRALFFEQDLKEATDGPRIFEQWIPNPARYDYLMDKKVVEGLQSLGHDLSILHPEALGAVVQTIERRDGLIYAYADDRKRGGVEGD